eukprot:COSAG01_NODE_5511_length_4210_cov_69.237898_3_plen_91_part_00
MQLLDGAGEANSAAVDASIGMPLARGYIQARPGRVDLSDTRLYGHRYSENHACTSMVTTGGLCCSAGVPAAAPTRAVRPPAVYVSRRTRD